MTYSAAAHTISVESNDMLEHNDVAVGHSKSTPNGISPGRTEYKNYVVVRSIKEMNFAECTIMDGKDRNWFGWKKSANRRKRKKNMWKVEIGEALYFFTLTALQFFSAENHEKIQQKIDPITLTAMEVIAVKRCHFFLHLRTSYVRDVFDFLLLILLKHYNTRIYRNTANCKIEMFVIRSSIGALK